jgi:hypothetical protein
MNSSVSFQLAPGPVPVNEQAARSTETEFADARERKWVFKDAEMRAFACALLAVALNKPFSQPWFGADEVSERPGDGTTPGAVTKTLLVAGVIAPYRGTHPELEMYGGLRPSPRKENHGHRTQTYTLAWGREAVWRLVTLWRAELQQELKPQKELCFA